MKIESGSECEKQLREFITSGKYLIPEVGSFTIGRVTTDDVTDENIRVYKSTSNRRRECVYSGDKAVAELVKFYEKYLENEKANTKQAYSDACKARDGAPALHDKLCQTAYDAKLDAGRKLTAFKNSKPKGPYIVEAWGMILDRPHYHSKFHCNIHVMSDGPIKCTIAMKVCESGTMYPEVSETLTGSKANLDYAKEYMKVMARDFELTGEMNLKRKEEIVPTKSAHTFSGWAADSFSPGLLIGSYY